MSCTMHEYTNVCDFKKVLSKREGEEENSREKFQRGNDTHLSAIFFLFVAIDHKKMRRERRVKIFDQHC